MNHSIKYSLLSAIFVFSITLVSCDPSTNAASEIKKALSSNEDLYLDKYNKYIDCAYPLEEEIYSSMDYYYKWGSDDASANGYRKTSNGPLAISDRYIQEVEDVLKLEPEMEKIDQAMTVMMDKAKSIDGLIDEMKIYYDRGEFKDDDYAKAELWHPELEQKFEDFVLAFDHVRAEVNMVQKDLMRKDAERYKKEGLEARYNLVNAMISSEALVSLMDMPLSDIESFDSKLISSNLATFTSHSDRLLALYKDKEKVKSEFGVFINYLDVWITSSSGLISRTKDFLILTENLDLNSADDGQLDAVYDIQIDLTDNYNELVGNYNYLIK